MPISPSGRASWTRPERRNWQRRCTLEFDLEEAPTFTIGIDGAMDGTTKENIERSRKRKNKK